MDTGLSRYAFQALEKRAMVAPSTTRWSAHQDTVMIWAGRTTSDLGPTKRGTCKAQENWAGHELGARTLGLQVASWG